MVVLLLSVIALFIAGLSLLLVPLMSIFIGLGFLVIVYSLFELAKTQGRFALVVVMLLSLVVGASVEFKYQFPGLEDHYRKPRAERVPLTAACRPPWPISSLRSPRSMPGAPGRGKDPASPRGRASCTGRAAFFGYSVMWSSGRP